VKVVRNDQITIEQINQLRPDYIVISPGPCTPSQAGISIQSIQQFADKTPILGVCLGHQSIGQAFNGQVVHAKQIMHGKTSPIYHNNQGVFKNLDNPFTATRYHSLVVANDSLPPELEITAWTQTDTGQRDEIMGIRHKKFAIQGVQFHPESILTQHGHDLLQNFLNQV
jgi:anthranilate synthase component 2